MVSYLVTFLAVFAIDIFYVYYLKSVQENKPIKSSLLAVVLATISGIAVINYTTNHWLLIPAAAGAFVGTYAGMKLRLIK